jgi:hypothetical protein
MQRPRFSGPFSRHFAKQHARDAYTVGRKVADLFAFGDFSGAAVDGFVRIFIRCRAAAPLEQADEVAADLEVSFGRVITVGAE